MSNAQDQFILASKDAPKLKTSIKVGEEYRKIQFINGAYTPKADEVEIFQKLLETNPNFSQLVRIVDIEEAKKISLAHQQRLREQASAVKGPVTSMDVSKAARGKLADRDAELASMGMTPTMVADQLSRESELETNNFTMTEEAVTEKPPMVITPIDEGGGWEEELRKQQPAKSDFKL